jgi:hypothetical protein
MAVGHLAIDGIVRYPQNAQLAQSANVARQRAVELVEAQRDLLQAKQREELDWQLTGEFVAAELQRAQRHKLPRQRGMPPPSLL